MYTTELIDLTLDWAVAKVDGELSNTVQVGQRPTAAVVYDLESGTFVSMRTGRRYSPSTLWSQGGPMIERLLTEGLLMAATDPNYSKLEKFKASLDKWETVYRGNTPLIAVMRCYVARQLGAIVDIPDFKSHY